MKVNKKVVILVVTIIAAVAILFSQSAVLSATAQNGKKLKDILNLDPNAQEVISEPTYDFSNVKLIDKKQADKNAIIMAKAKQLISKAEKAYLTEGWFHMLSSTKAFSTAQQTFPDGTLIPTEWTDDLWVLLDKHGDAIKAVTIQDTGDPKLMQIGVYENGVWTNISLEITTPEEKYHPTFSSGLLLAESSYKDIEKLTTETSVINGQNTVVFTTEDNLKTPINTEKENKKDQQIYGSVIKYYFAESSGLPVQIEDYHIKSGGSLEILQRIVINIIENVSTPPANILAYLTK